MRAEFEELKEENRRLREHLADSDQRCYTAVQLLQQARDGPRRALKWLLAHGDHAMVSAPLVLNSRASRQAVELAVLEVYA